MPKTRGFTLVEMVMVIAIIAVLAALVIVGGGAALAAARRSACLNNLRQIGLAMHSYTQAHPITSIPGLKGNNLPPCEDTSGTPWTELLAPYEASDPALFTCPEGGGYGLNPLAGAEYWYMQNMFATYTLMPAETRPTNLDRIVKPAQTVLVVGTGRVNDATAAKPYAQWEVDAAANWKPYAAFPLIDTWSGTLGKTVNHGYDWGNTVGNSGRGSMEWDPNVRPVGRHGESVGTLFVDGHVGMIELGKLVTPQLGQEDCLFDNQPAQ